MENKVKKNLIDQLSIISWQDKTKIETQIANKCLKMYYNDSYSSIKDLASELHISEASITVFAKKLEFDGYRDLISRLKYERYEYLFKYDVTKKVDTKSFENSIIAILQQGSQIKIMIDNIKNKKIYILSSSQLFDAAHNLNDVFKKYKLDSTIFKNQYLFYEAKNNVSKDDVIIFLYSGQDNNILTKVYNNFSNTNKNIYIFSSNSQMYKFNNYKMLFPLDLPNMPKHFIHRNISMNIFLSIIYQELNLNVD